MTHRSLVMSNTERQQATLLMNASAH